MKNFLKTNKKIFIILLLLASLVVTYSIGNYTLSKIINKPKAETEIGYEYNYTGDVQEFVVPYTGIYKLEAYGAAGGNQTSNGAYGRDVAGGRGGYSKGYVTLTKGETLYIYVGGKGATVANQIVNEKGGYNGGAGGSEYKNTESADIWQVIQKNTVYFAPGGGATHIATVDRGTLDTYENNKEDILMVAGGGGGAIYSYAEGITLSQTGSQDTPWKESGYANGGAGGGTVSTPIVTNIRNWQGSGEYGFANGYVGGGAGWISGYNSAGGAGYVSDELTEGVMQNNFREGDGYVKITLEEIIPYTISYDANTGEGSIEPTTSEEQNINGIAIALLEENTFTKEGYEFVEWNTEADGSGDGFEAGSEIEVSEDTTLYAIWTPVVYDLDYDLNGGEIEEENVSEYTIETEDFTLNNPTRVGYEFLGWTSDEITNPQVELTIVKGTTGDKEFTANWKANDDTQYIVRHWLQNMNSDKDGEIEANYTQADINKLYGTSDTDVIPRTNNYIGFTSPTPQKYTVAADGSLIVDYLYVRNKYIFTLEDCEGVDLSESAQTGVYSYQEELTLKANVLPGYTWQKWSKGETDQTITIVMDSSDVIITPFTTKNEYTIEYKSNEIGSNTTVFDENPTTYTVTDSFLLNNPEKEGYTFLGWTIEGSDEEPDDYYIVEEGTTGNLVFVANWEANDDTPYVVKHLLQNLDTDPEDLENYTLEDIDSLEGESDSTVVAEVYEYEGFTSPEEREVTITPDGSLEVYYYYPRNKYSFTVVDTEGVNTEGSTPNGEYYYEAEITIDANVLPGYTWVKWFDRVTESETEYLKAIFTMPYSNVEMEPIVTKDEYNIIYNLDGGEIEAKDIYTVTDEDYTLPIPEKDGYVFIGWTSDEIEEPQEEVIIPQGSTGDKEYTANWELDSRIKYVAQYYMQNKTLDGYTIKEEKYRGEAFATVTIAPKTIIGFTYDSENENNKESGTIETDGSLVLKYYYNRNTYSITFNTNEGTINSEYPTSYVYEEEVILPTDVTREGYEFDGWYEDKELTKVALSIMPGSAGNKTYFAKWNKIETEPTPVEEAIIKSEIYRVNAEEKLVENVRPETDAKAFIEEIESDEEITVRILDRDGNEVEETALVGTGYKIEITKADGTVEVYEIVVLGDIDGDGKIGITDISTLSLAIVGNVELTPIEAKAADLDYNGEIAITDLATLALVFVESVPIEDLYI